MECGELAAEGGVGRDQSGRIHSKPLKSTLPEGWLVGGVFCALPPPRGWLVGGVFCAQCATPIGNPVKPPNPGVGVSRGMGLWQLHVLASLTEHNFYRYARTTHAVVRAHFFLRLGIREEETPRRTRPGRPSTHPEPRANPRGGAVRRARAKARKGDFPLAPRVSSIPAAGRGPPPLSAAPGGGDEPPRRRPARLRRRPVTSAPPTRLMAPLQGHCRAGVCTRRRP